jgi:hypothetical protein
MRAMKLAKPPATEPMTMDTNVPNAPLKNRMEAR